MAMPKALRICLTALMLAGAAQIGVANAGPACAPAGQWLLPASGKTGDFVTLIPELAGKKVVLLGETHDRFEHHIWQFQVASALRAQRRDMAIAFEAFPRRVQPALDRWVAGDLTEKAFLDESDWNNVWRFDPALYMPLFQFARLNRMPMVAMNVERSLVRKVSQNGWTEVPEAEREGVSQPAPPAPAYVDFLWRVFEQHPAAGSDKDAAKPTRTYPAFQSFIRGQTMWDRAMAEGIAGALRDHPDRLVVGILGFGHVQEGWGVAHQLADLGISEVVSMLPWTEGSECSDLTETVADAVFGMRLEDRPAALAQRPRLGVMVDQGEAGVVIRRVMTDSVAAAAGLREQDIVLQAAGVDVKTTAELIAIVQRQAPGTWLPLSVRRGEETVEIVARFPAGS